MENLRQPSEWAQLGVTVTLDRFNHTQHLVERFACRPGNSRDMEEETGGDILGLSSIEAVVRGKLHINEGDKERKIGFHGIYFFTCLRNRRGENILHWEHSLS